MLKGKKVIVLGERDDVTGDVIQKCLEVAGATIIYSTTACFVWTAAGSADLAEQDEVKELADKHGNKDLIVVFGLNQPFTLRTMGVTFKDGDPSFSGSLGGVALGLKSYHILELKDQIPEDVWEEEMGMKEFEIEDDLVDNILKTMKDVRGE